MSKRDVMAETVVAQQHQITEVRRVIACLKGAGGSIHGPVVDEVRRSTGEWLEAALEGRLKPDDPACAYYPRKD